MNEWEQATIYVSFGPKPHQEIRKEVAETMLTRWRERDPAGFGSYLAEAMTDVAPKVRKARP